MEVTSFESFKNEYCIIVAGAWRVNVHRRHGRWHTEGNWGSGDLDSDVDMNCENGVLLSDSR